MRIILDALRIKSIEAVFSSKKQFSILSPKKGATVKHLPLESAAGIIISEGIRLWRKSRQTLVGTEP